MTDEDFDPYDGFDEIENTEAENRAAKANKGVITRASGDPLGHVLASRELQIGRHETALFAYIQNDSRNNIRVGDYVLLPYVGGDGQASDHAEMFGVVQNLHYAHRTEIEDDTEHRSTTADVTDINEQLYTLVARISPINIVTESEGNLDSKGVNRIPKPFTHMYAANNENYLRQGLNIPEEGPFVGHMAVGGQKRPRGNPLPFKMPDKNSGEPAIFRHTIVGGSTGKGKTHFMKNLLRQYATEDTYEIEVEGEEGDAEQVRSTVGKQLSTVIIDPENEYHELANDNPDLPSDDNEPIPELDGTSANDLRDDGVKVGGINDQPGSNDLRTYVPNVAYTTEPPASNSYSFSIPFNIVRGRPALLMPFDAGEPTRDAIRQSLSIFFDRQPDGTYQDYMSFMDDAETYLTMEDEDIEAGMHPPGSSWVEDASINENMFAAMKRRVYDKAVFNAVFDQGSNPIVDTGSQDGLTAEMFQPGRTVVVPTNHLGGPKERLVVMCVLSLVVENKLKDYNPDYNVKNTPIYLVLDEAHNYLGEPTNAQERFIVGKYREAARQGRKYKLGLGLITQNPNDIDEETLKQINSKIYLGLEPEVTEELRIPGNYQNDILDFGKGQAVVKAPDVRPVEVVGLPVCVTEHE